MGLTEGLLRNNKGLENSIYRLFRICYMLPRKKKKKREEKMSEKKTKKDLRGLSEKNVFFLNIMARFSSFLGKLI